MAVLCIKVVTGQTFTADRALELVAISLNIDTEQRLISSSSAYSGSVDLDMTILQLSRRNGGASASSTSPIPTATHPRATSNEVKTGIATKSPPRTSRSPDLDSETFEPSSLDRHGPRIAQYRNRLDRAAARSAILNLRTHHALFR